MNIIQYHEKYLFSIIYLFNDPNVFFRENTYTTQQREDSLLSLLKSSPAINEQIELYKDLATMYRQMPKEIVYLNKMADVASSTSKGHASLYYAWANLSRHYYNIQNRDSLIYWSHKIDSLAAPRMRFRTHYSMREDSFAKWIYGTAIMS